MLKLFGFPPVQVEGEDILLHFLLAHDVVKDRSNPVHRDAWVGHAEDPIKLGSDEGHAGLLDGFTKKLLFHGYVSNLGKQEKVSHVKLH